MPLLLFIPIKYKSAQEAIKIIAAKIMLRVGIKTMFIHKTSFK